MSRTYFWADRNLIHAAGEQEHVQTSPDVKKDIKSLGIITMELIQGYAKEDGNIGLDKPERWPRGMDFLSATVTASRVDALSKVRGKKKRRYD